MDTNRDRRAVALGAYGERIAARFLTEAGMRVIDRNWRCPQGEIDIVALDGDCLVVCEVKTRRTDAYGDAVEAVTPRKLARLRTLAGCWIEAHAPQGARGDVRIDVVGVLRPVAGPSRVTHLRGVTA